MRGKKRLQSSEIDFKEVYLFILSIVHGGLFFVYIEQMNETLKIGVTVKSIALLLFLFILFVRIFQSQILAALKYREWKFSFGDLFIPFITAIIEHQIFWFSNRNLTHLLFLIRVMIVLGILGYLYTYWKIKNHRTEREYCLYFIMPKK